MEGITTPILKDKEMQDNYVYIYNSGIALMMTSQRKSLRMMLYHRGRPMFFSMKK